MKFFRFYEWVPLWKQFDEAHQKGRYEDAFMWLMLASLATMVLPLVFVGVCLVLTQSIWKVL